MSYAVVLKEDNAESTAQNLSLTAGCPTSTQNLKFNIKSGCGAVGSARHLGC